jgi:hypothetical protein
MTATSTRRPGRRLPPTPEQSRRQAMLSRAVRIYCCKDGTITYGDRSFNGIALPIFSVDNMAQAEQLQIAFCRKQYKAHPQIPGADWFRVNEAQPSLEIEQLDGIADRFDEFYRKHLEGKV